MTPTLANKPHSKPRPRKKPDTTAASGTRRSRDVRIAGAVLDVIDDPSSVQEWDEEELKRGQRRSKNGNFAGRPPNFVPHECYMELQRRHVQKAAIYFAEHCEEMAEILAEIANNPQADSKARVQAAKIMLDRAMGVQGSSGQTNNVLVLGNGTKPKYMQAIEAGIVSTDSGGDDDIIDAEIIE